MIEILGDIMYKEQFKRSNIDHKKIVEHWESLSRFNRMFRQPKKYKIQYRAAIEYLEETRRSLEQSL